MSQLVHYSGHLITQDTSLNLRCLRRLFRTPIYYLGHLFYSHVYTGILIQILIQIGCV